MISKEKQKSIIEALLFVSTEPLSLNKIVRKLRAVDRQDAPQGEVPDGDQVITQVTEEDHIIEDEDDIRQQLLSKQKELEEEITTVDVRLLLKEIQDELSGEQHGIELVTVAKGYQLRTKYATSLYLKNEKINAPSRFSPSSLETLAIVAYQQPITRHKIEEVRGVDSGGVMKTLLDKGILRVVGRSDEPGKPLIYGTSKRFLEIFGIEHLKDLPSLQDYSSLDLSQKRDESAGQQRFSGDLNLDDLIEDDYEALTEVEEAVLENLNLSMKDLRKVEKDVLISTGLQQVQNDEQPPQENQPLDS